MNLQDVVNGLIDNPVDDGLLKILEKFIFQSNSNERRLVDLKSICSQLKSGEIGLLSLDEHLKKLSIYEYTDLFLGDTQVQVSIEDDIDTALISTFLEEAEVYVGILCSSFKNPKSIDIDKVFRAVHTLKGAAVSVGLNHLSRALHDIESFLSIQRDCFNLVKEDFERLEIFSQTIKKICSFVGGGQTESIPYDLLEVMVEKIYQRENFDLSLKTNLRNFHFAPTINSTDVLRIPASRINDLFLEIDRLQTFHSESERTFLQINQSLQIPAPLRRKLDDKLSAVRGIVDRIQREVISFRLVPFRQLLPRLKRVASETSAQTGKKVYLEFDGGSIEIKKSIVDKLGDILIHLVKNSVDHGIENLEQRLKHGKKEIGHIAIKASINRSQIVVSIQDDGAGIDKKRVINRAVDHEIVAADQVEKLEDSEIYDLIFHPGFSTAESITSISGRGVGMDAVKSMVNGLAGRIKIESSDGGGTKTQLTFPSDVLVEEVVVIRSGEQNFAVLLSAIEAIISIDRDDIESLKNYPYYETAQELIPVVTLSSLTGLPESIDNTEGLLLIRDKDKNLGLLVDKVVRKGQIIASPAPKIFERYFHISGVFTLDDGGLCAIIHPTDLVEMVRQQGNRYVS